MSSITDALLGVAGGEISTVIVDSEFLPGPITIQPGINGAPATSSSPIAAMLQPSIQVLNNQGDTVYTFAPYGQPTDRLKAYLLLGLIGAGIFFSIYGAARFFKKS